MFLYFRVVMREYTVASLPDDASQVRTVSSVLHECVEVGDKTVGVARKEKGEGDRGIG